MPTTATREGGGKGYDIICVCGGIRGGLLGWKGAEMCLKRKKGLKVGLETKELR